jgi:hypothetical protein
MHSELDDENSKRKGSAFGKMMTEEPPPSTLRSMDDARLQPYGLSAVAT